VSTSCTESWCTGTRTRLRRGGTAALSRAAVGLVVLALVAAGCGGDTVDASKAEEGIESSPLATSTAEITSASCPSDVEKQKDGTFTCDVKLSGGGKAEVTVTQTSDRNTFSYAFKPGTVVLPGETVDKQLEQDLEQAGVADAQVSCPSSVAVKPGTTVTCPVTFASGAQGSVSFEFSDSSGTVDPSSVEES
jgi:hypothetical protein